jgi:hypothetical protein
LYVGFFESGDRRHRRLRHVCAPSEVSYKKLDAKR